MLSRLLIDIKMPCAYRWVREHGEVLNVDGNWMDPIALYRRVLPFDSALLKTLPESEKKVSVSVMLEDGIIILAGVKAIWHYVCTQQR